MTDAHARASRTGRPGYWIGQDQLRPFQELQDTLNPSALADSPHCDGGPSSHEAGGQGCKSVRP